MLGNLDGFFADPKGMLIVLLLALPGRALALSAHEFSHAWMANRCGDPTAKYLGRMTMNPLKHLDLVGTLLMLFVGFGWAKPVPVNPRNFRNYRRDDLKVSLAGITMNIMLFLLGSILLYGIVAVILATLPERSIFSNLGSEICLVEYYDGDMCVNLSAGLYTLDGLIRYASYPGVLSELLITPLFGATAGYAFDMLVYFVLVNIALAVFNLIPMPPLDGYHVVNDLFLKKSLFATQRISQICSVIMIVLFMNGTLSEVLWFVEDGIMQGVSQAAQWLMMTLGII